MKTSLVNEFESLVREDSIFKIELLCRRKTFDQFIINSFESS